MSIHPSEECDSDDELLRLDAACDAFERDLAAGLNPSIESYIEKHPDLDPKVLRYELVKAECHHRKVIGEKPDLAAYSERYFLETEEIDRLKSDLSRESAAPTKAIEDSTEKIHDGEFELSADDAATGEAAIAMLERHGFLDVRRIGRGAYGEVYRAYDPQRDCDVAIKTPTDKTLVSPKARQRFLKEAQIGKELDHPNIVKTLGIESFDGRDLIIQRFIDGQNLEQWFDAFRKRDELPEPETVVELLLPVARALAHVHQRGYSHQDLKPENILIDQVGNVFVTDFGLTIHESEQRSWRGSRAGTMPYMSPEQIRWQTHLIDGRSDIWSFGVILYRLLLGKLPFGGPPPKSKSEQEQYCDDLEKEITELDPRPIRLVRTNLSRQLTGICKKCLEKSRKDRYENGDDLAEDLLLFLDKRSESVPSATPKRPIKIVPKGLRSFDAGDCDFFLELLPGPRYSDGVPESIRFLENRLEGADGNEPLDLGIIFGPSGSGKSSLVKAGLIPRLQNKNYETLFIEATAEDTEVRLVKGLRGKLIGPGDTKFMAMKDLFPLVAQRYKANGRKLLVVIDQFEQWLAANTDFATDQLVETFRQCNGVGIQVLILTREDFWWRLNEFTSAIELSLSERSNYLRVKLFDRDHARRILMAFGEAYGKLPPAERIRVDQEEFLEKSLDDLADQNEYVPVRLALFAEMMSDRPWTLEELKRIGGAKGVGVAFLESRFGRNAPIEMKPYVEIAPRLLEAMLPPLGSDIKGQMLSVAELGDSTKADPKKLASLLQLMEGDLKLLTKVAPDLPEGQVSSAVESEPTGLTMYQLTHDYLVGSIRQWLDERSRGSRSGRAKLMLRTQTELWNRLNRSARYLPTSMEWLGMRLRTDKSEWTPMQAAMMRQSACRSARKALIALAGLSALALGGWLTFQHLERKRIKSLYEADLKNLLSTDFAQTKDTGRVNRFVDQYQDIIDIDAISLDFANSSDINRKTMLAMIAVKAGEPKPEHLSYLYDKMILGSTDNPVVWKVLNQFLLPFSESIPESVLEQSRLSEQPTKTRIASRLRVKATEAALNGSNLIDADEVESENAKEIVDAMLEEPESGINIWTDAFSIYKDALLPELSNSFEEQNLFSARAHNAAFALIHFDNDEFEYTVQTLSAQSTDIDEYRALVRELNTLDSLKKQEIVKALHRQIALLDSRIDETANARIDTIPASISKLALAEWRLGNSSDLERFISREPRFGLTRGLVSEMLINKWIDFELVWSVVNQPNDHHPLLPIALLSIDDELQMMTKSSPPLLSELEQEKLKSRLESLAMNHPSAEVQATSLLLWRKLERSNDFPENTQQISINDHTKNWRYSKKHKLIMVRLDLPKPNGDLHSFEIASTEMTQDLYCQLKGKGKVEEPGCPLYVYDIFRRKTLPIFEIANICNQLSISDGIADSELCYEFDEKQESYSVHINRSGYRLPTLEELTFACSCTGWDKQFKNFSESEINNEDFEPTERIERYAWLHTNSLKRRRAVGSKLPNPNGLFDLYGNAMEIAMDLPVNSIGFSVSKTELIPLFTIGLSTDSLPEEIRPAIRNVTEPKKLDDGFWPPTSGFRVVRTVKAE